MKNAPGTLYDYLQSVQSYIAPPITVIFLLGILSKRVTASGAMATLWIGMAIGLFRLTLDTITTFTGQVFEGFLGSVAAIPFSHFAIVIFLICLVVHAVVSMMGTKPSEAQLAGLTFGTLSQADKDANKMSYGWPDIVASIFVIAVIIGILLYFTG